jgi:transcriptional regulator with XRE-family HTH domain
MMTAATCRAARALLGLTQAQLAARASVGLSTVKHFEGGNYKPIANNRKAIEAALVAAGVDFIGAGDGSAAGGAGVRLKA